MKPIKRVATLFLTLVLAFSMLAVSSGASDDWQNSGGGTGNAGKVGSGAWSQRMQGIRVTIIDKYGNPAMSYGSHPEWYSLDLLYHVDRLDEVDYSLGGCKALYSTDKKSDDEDSDKSYYCYSNNGNNWLDGPGRDNVKTGIHSNAIAFGWLLNAINGEQIIDGKWTQVPKWPYRAPNENALENYKKLMKLYPITDTPSGWALHGEEIRELIYGDADAKKPKDDAALYVMFNIRNAVGLPVWHLTPQAIEDNGIPKEVVSDYEAGANFETKERWATGIMQEYNFAVVVEPIIWVELRTTLANFSDLVLYGTPTNISEKIIEMVNTGEWRSSVAKYGGADQMLMRATRHSFVFTKDLTYGGKTFKVPDGASNNYQYVFNDEMIQKDLGWAMHMYICGSTATDVTHTYDNEVYPPEKYKEGQAPDPKVDSKTKAAIPKLQDQLTYKIVKVYEEKMVGTMGQEQITHVTTTERVNTLPKIKIEDEPAGGYKVIEWKYSPDYTPPIEETTEWTDPKISTVTPIKTGDGQTTVDIKDPEGVNKEIVLYVRLQKEVKPGETRTWDEPTYPGGTPGPAPDPTTQTDPDPIPADNPYSVQRIVKVYQIKKSDGSIQHQTTTIRNQTAPIIKVESEGPSNDKWSLIEWKYGDGQPAVSGGTKWTDAPISTVTPIGSGITEGKVNILDPNNPLAPRTLYVLLQKTEVPIPGDTHIYQSQISKAIHTDAKTMGTGKWGDYNFAMTIGSFTRSHITYFSHGCCGGCDPSCGGCHGHTCTLSMPGSSGDNKLNFVFGQTNSEVSLQVKTGVNENTNPKVYNNNGINPRIIPSMFAASNTNLFVSDGNQSNGSELVTVIWRGGANTPDIPTLALYKKADITTKWAEANYKIPNDMLKNASNVSKRTRASMAQQYDLKIQFGVDQSKSDLIGIASCQPLGGHQCIYRDVRNVYPIMGTSFTYDFEAKVAVQFYAGRGKSVTTMPFNAIVPAGTTRTVSTGTHFSNNIIQGKQQIKFYPYIKMTYMTNNLGLAEKEEENTESYKQATRYETYVLSEYESSILPSDSVEVGWTNTKEEESLLMTSQQWSLHQKAVNGINGTKQAWNGANQVLPGGAMYQLSTPNGQHTNVKIITYQTVVDSKTRSYLSSALSGDEYTESKVAKDHNDFVNDAKEILDNLRLVQWVNKDFSASKAWNTNWNEAASNQTTALCVRGGGESLAKLGLTLQSSTDAKYYMKKVVENVSYQTASMADKTSTMITGDKETASEGDLDILNVSNVITTFKVFTDTSGNVYMAKVQTNTTTNVEQTIKNHVNQLKDVNADTYQRLGVSAELLCNKYVAGDSINYVLTNDAKQIDDRTSFITNIVSALNRNQGSDKTAAWAADGAWYNEAFDGIYLVRQATTLEVGLQYPATRLAALDPALCPPNKGQSDLYSQAFLSQFCMNNRSDAAIATGKDPQYLGTFKGKDITLPDMQGMYQSRKFYIPNANVQDLN